MGKGRDEHGGIGARGDQRAGRGPWRRRVNPACNRGPPKRSVSTAGVKCGGDPGDGIAMPIRPELRPLYPPHWRELSSRVRFERAQGRCQRCGWPHLVLLRCLPDGRWFDEQAATWRDRRGRPARWPDLMETPRFRMTRVVLAAAHLDSDPTNNRLKNLRALCQRCHMLHDRPHHLAQRWIHLPPALGSRRSLSRPIPGRRDDFEAGST
jgi:hypothetical protein